MIESGRQEQNSRPSAFALAIIFGGTVGLTVSQMLGLSGDFGFIIGFFVFFIIMLVAILKARSLNIQSDDRDKLIARLESEVITLRIGIFDNFIASGTEVSYSETTGSVTNGKEISELFDVLKRLRESGRFSDKARPLEKVDEIKDFKAEVEEVAEKILKLQQYEKYAVQLKALEILKLDAEREIDYLADKGAEV